MSVWKTQFGAEPVGASSPSASQASEGTLKSCSGITDVEPTEVTSSSHKTTHGKSSERNVRRPSPQRHAASSTSESSHHLVGHVSSLSHVSVPSRTNVRRDEDSYSTEYTDSLENSFTGTAGTEGTNFLRRIPKIPASYSSNEQCSRDERTGHTPFPPPHYSSNFGPNYFPTPPSDVKRLPRDSNNSGDLPFHKQLANKQPKGSRVKGQAEAEMQRNVAPESLLEDSSDLRVRPKPRHDCQTKVVHPSRADLPEMDGHRIVRGRSQERQPENLRPQIVGGVNERVYYESTQQRHSSRVAVYNNTKSGWSGRRYNSSGTDSQITTSGTESDMSSSPDFQSCLKRKRRFRRKPSAKSIDSSVFGEDNSSEESEVHNCDEGFSDVYAGVRAPNTEPEKSSKNHTYGSQESVTGRVAPLQNLSKLRSSSLTCVSTLEGRTASPLQSSSVARVSKIQISSFAGVTGSKPDSKGDQNKRRSSLDEGRFSRDGDRFHSEKTCLDVAKSLPNQQLSKSPFNLKAKPFGLRGKLSHGNSLASDSDSSVTSPSVKSDRLETRETATNSAFSETRIQECSSFQDENSFGSKDSAFESVKPTARRREQLVALVGDDHEDESPVSEYPMEPSGDMFDDAFSVQEGPEAKQGNASDVQDGSSFSVPDLESCPAYGQRPLSIVCEQDEYPDNMACQKNFVKESNEKNRLHRSSPVTKNPSLGHRISSSRDHSVREDKSVKSHAPAEADTVTSAVRRPSYVQAQRNSEMQSLKSASDTHRSPKYSDSNINETSHGFRTVQDLDSSDDLYDYEVLQSMYFSGSESCRKQGKVSPAVMEGDLISFIEDEKDEVPPREPKEMSSVEKRKKKKHRPKIPTILSCDDVEKLKQYYDGVGAREDVGEHCKEFGDDFSNTVIAGDNNKDDVSEIHQISKRNSRDINVVHGSDDDCTPTAISEAVGHQLDVSMRDENQPNDSVFEVESHNEQDDEDREGQMTSLHASGVPQITAEMYSERNSQIDKEREFPIERVEDFDDLSHGKKRHSGPGYPEFLYREDKGLVDRGSPSDLLASPSPSQHSFDANSMTTSGFSEAHSEQISTTDLHDESDYGSLESSIMTSNNHWRSQSDPSGRTNGNGAPLSETIAEAERVSVQRNSNSEPNLSAEKLKKEKEQLAKRLNGGVHVIRSHSSPESLPKFDHYGKQANEKDINKERVIAEGSPDECFELDKPESPVRPTLKRTKSPPIQLTPVRPKYTNSYSNEKAQIKLNKLAAMEPIYELTVTEPATPVSSILESTTSERKYGAEHHAPFLASAIQSPVQKEEKRRVSGAGAGQQEGKPSKKKHDMRKHVFQNLLETEHSYVQNLQYLVSNYYKPLKKADNAASVESAQVDEMFYQIPEILICHESFLEQLQLKVKDWHDKQKIGDIFVSSFTKCFLMDAYSGFINHFFLARTAVRVATMSKPGFARFIEQCVREHKEKLTLQDLMIMPVQRIPRYELLLKDMIKHTPPDHPDHSSLQLALIEIKALADRMNRGEKEVDQAEREAEKLRDLETTIEGMTDLAIPSRKLLRQDLVAEVKGSITKKDRCLFFFNDMLACGTVKRKAHALRRGSLSLFSGQSGTEFNKYKLLWKLPLECMEIVKASPEAQRRNSIEKLIDKLDNDMAQLSKISSIADSLAVGHQLLDTAIRELMNDVSKQISEKQVPAQPSTSKLELQAQTEDGVENYLFLFLGTSIRNSWETFFENAKQKLAYAKDAFPPEFQCPVQIKKHRSGMQFTCASPSLVPHMLDRGNHCGSGDVWVCNSDGYVGEVSILSMGNLQPVKTLDVCKARILCISPVPGSTLIGLDCVETDNDTKSDRVSLISETSLPNRKLSSGAYSRDDSVVDIIAFDSSSEDEEGNGSNGFVGNKFNDTCSSGLNGRLSPEGSSLGEDTDSDQENNISESYEHDSSEDETKGKGTRKHQAQRETAVSLDSLRSEDGQSLTDYIPYEHPADEDSTVWLGAEDGSIYVYSVNEAKTKGSKRMPDAGYVQSILYVDNQVFLSLSSGHLCVFRRQPGCAWEVGSPVMVDIGNSTPITCMTAVHGRLWCGCGSDAIIVNTTTLEIEKSFNCCLDKNRNVYRMASSGMGVWLSLQSSAVVRLFHATRYESLADVDMAPPVEKMLSGSDAIIRQHKAACLRVTSLLGCKDLLWIGTSAGVVLTLPLPTITASTSCLQNCPAATASFHGHTGHVRFLTAVEVPKERGEESTIEKEPNPLNVPASTREILIISGGDGYEDFRMNSSNESAGRDDSTNHLLIWRV